MNERNKYESVEVMKADLTPLEKDPAQSKASHARFERFAKRISQSMFVDESPVSHSTSTHSSANHEGGADRVV